MSDAESEHEVNRDEEFKKAVREYVALTDELTEIRATINKKNKRKRSLTEFIIAYMQDNRKDICNLGASGVLRMKESKASVALKKEHVQQLLMDIIGEEKAKESAQYIFENREKKISYKLERKPFE